MSDDIPSLPTDPRDRETLPPSAPPEIDSSPLTIPSAPPYMLDLLSRLDAISSDIRELATRGEEQQRRNREDIHEIRNAVSTMSANLETFLHEFARHREKTNATLREHDTSIDALRNDVASMRDEMRRASGRISRVEHDVQLLQVGVR